jgi:hypothetical protein
MGKTLNEGRDAFFANAPGNAEIRKAIPGAMGSYVQSFQGNPSGPAQVAAMTQAVNLYARQLAYEGADPDKAATQAFDDLVGKRYSFADSYRVPKGVDDALVAAGTRAIKSGLGDNIEMDAAAAGVSDADRRTSSARKLGAKGVWITRADDKGLYLAWPMESGFKPALDAKGRPLSFSWAALQAAGQHQPTVNDILQFRDNEGGR